LDDDDKKCPVLAEIVSTLVRDTWDDDRTRALLVVMRRAIRKLPNDHPKQSRLTWREIGEIMCGLRSVEMKEEHEHKRGYNRSLQGVRYQLIPPSLDETWVKRNITRPLRTRLAEILLAFEPELTSIANGSAGLAGYVPRPALHDAFNQLVARGEKLIVLVGQAGMGKTWLARALTTGPDGSAPRIRVIDSKLDTGDLQAALASHSMESKAPITGEPKEFLASLTCGSQAPDFVVLDNLGSAEELRAHIPTTTRSVVVATCRTRGENPPEACRFLPVGRMETAEAVALVANRAPHLSEPDATELAKVLGAYPLVLHHACALLTHQPVVRACPT
jgi:hypothetical protein